MKTIYYAFVQKIKVPDNLSEEEIDKFIFETVGPKTDYIWSEEPDLFDFEKYW